MSKTQPYQSWAMKAAAEIHALFANASYFATRNDEHKQQMLAGWAEIITRSAPQPQPCPITHRMSIMGHVGVEACKLPADHVSDCLVEWMGQRYWCSQQGWEGHPPKPIREMAEMS